MGARRLEVIPTALASKMVDKKEPRFRTAGALDNHPLQHHSAIEALDFFLLGL